MKVAIVGVASRIDRQFAQGIEPVIREVVDGALEAAALSIADVDMVVTVASDTIDGMMVPIRAELAGALGKTYLNVSSSAGHAVAAAAAAIEAGDAETVLVVGWGAASKLATSDGRANQFDPFYMRPLGASPSVVAALQKQILSASGLTSEADIAAFGGRMAGACWGGGAETLPGGFCDGAAAIVLRAVVDGVAGVMVTDHSVASRSHTPGEQLPDPGIWVNEAISALSWTSLGAPRGFIEVSGPTLTAELRGVDAIIGSGLVECDAAAANGAGGGASAWFGPATGLRALADRCAGSVTTGVFVDLAGPLGQHVTGLLIEQRREP
jgi:hypothetical protein